MGKDFIDFLIENPQEIPAALKNEKEKYGISWDKAKEFRERWEQEAERDKAFLH